MTITDPALLAEAQRAGDLAAAAARMGGLSIDDISSAYHAAYDAVIEQGRLRLQTTELGKIERSLAQKIKDAG